MRRAQIFALLGSLAVGWVVAELLVHGPPTRARVLAATLLGVTVFILGSALVAAYRRRKQ